MDGPVWGEVLWQGGTNYGSSCGVTAHVPVIRPSRDPLNQINYENVESRDLSKTGSLFKIGEKMKYLVLFCGLLRLSLGLDITTTDCMMTLADMFGGSLTSGKSVF